MDYSLIFLTGLTIGGVSCMAVQGGLLASLLSNTKSQESVLKNHTTVVTSIFLISKLAAYTALGAILGALSQRMSITDRTQTYLQLISGIYMVLVAGNLLELHPLLRYTVPQPPKFFGRLARSQSRSSHIFAPAFLGLVTVLIPCGTTLAMESLAIASGSARTGALIMSIFTIATFPTFIGIGFLVSLTSTYIKNYFTKIASVLIISLGLWSINGSLIVMGSPITIPSIISGITAPFRNTTPAQNQFFASQTGEAQSAEILVTPRGYSPSNIVVKRGIPLTLKIKSQNIYSCATAFRIPSLNISKNLEPTDEQIITFTPMQSGPIPFACSMGMYTGTITVI